MSYIQLSAAYAAIALACAASVTPATAATERAVSESALPTVVARENEPGDDRGRGRGGRRNDDGKGHRLSDDAAGTQVARENEPGDDRGRGRGGRRNDDGKGHTHAEDTVVLTA